MIWLPIMVVELVVAFVDPYIGAFALFPAVMLFIFAMCEVNLRARIRVGATQLDPSEDSQDFSSVSRASAKGVLQLFRFVAAFSLACLGYVYIFLTWLLVTGPAEKAYTFAVVPVSWGPVAGMVVAVLLVAMQVAACVNVFLYQGHVDRLAARYAREGEGLKAEAAKADLSRMRLDVSPVSLALVGVTTLFAVLSPLGWFGLIGLTYLWDVLIIKIVLGATKRTRRASSPDLPAALGGFGGLEEQAERGTRIARGAATRQLSEFLPGGTAERTTVVVTWVVWLVVVGCFLMIVQLTDPAGLASPLLWISIVAATGAAASLTRDMRAIGRSALE